MAQLDRGQRRARRTSRYLTRLLAAAREAVTLFALFGLTFWLAFQLRFDFQTPPEWAAVLWRTIGWFLLVKWAVFAWMRVGEGWRYHVTFGDLVVLAQATATACLVNVAIDYFLIPGQIPRSVIVMDAMLTLLIYGGIQSLSRWFREHLRGGAQKADARRALLVVGDQATAVLANQINSHSSLDYRICGVLTTHLRRRHQRHGRVLMLGHVRDVEAVAEREQIQDVLVVAGAVSGRRMRWLMSACERAGLELKIIPPLRDLFSGDRRIPLRGIEIDDLLRRTPVQLDDDSIREWIEGRRVLVTGAGGSIGSEVCRQVIRFRPSELLLLGRGENRIFKIESQLQSLADSTQLTPTIACITDEGRMRQIFERFRPEVVFHAAAHKHVPLMEGNIGEAIKNNVGGTKLLVDLCDEYDVKTCVAISTDKAVKPTSVMGATKQLAEHYIRSVAARSAVQLVTVRLGNVLGSAGSVLPTFQEQLRRGGPITVTHPEMTRYFMTIPEAAQLVLQAGSMGRGGETFVLDMGEPVRIVDLARDLIRLSGLPSESIDIRYSGVRPGEKMYEELFGEGEESASTSHPKVMLARVDSELTGSYELDAMDLLEAARAGEDERRLLQGLRDALPSFRPLVPTTISDATESPAGSISENSP